MCVSTFVTLFNESTIIQGLVTAMLIMTLCLLYLKNGYVDDTLLALTGIIVGYWFRTKSDYQYKQGVKNVENTTPEHNDTPL